MPSKKYIERDLGFNIAYSETPKARNITAISCTLYYVDILYVTSFLFMFDHLMLIPKLARKSSQSIFPSEINLSTQSCQISPS